MVFFYIEGLWSNCVPFSWVSEMVELIKLKNPTVFQSLGKRVTTSYVAKAMRMKCYDLKNMLQ